MAGYPMSRDPRVCRDPFPFFSALTLAEVAEYDTLNAKAYRVLLEPQEMERWRELGRRRIVVPAEPANRDSA